MDIVGATIRCPDGEGPLCVVTLLVKRRIRAEISDRPELAVRLNCLWRVLRARGTISAPPVPGVIVH